MPKYCGTCHKIILPGHASTSIMNEEYHPDCLNCSKCGVRLGDRPFIQKRNGELYCEGQCEEAVTLPPINSNNPAIRRVYSFQGNQDANALKDKINHYHDLMENEEINSDSFAYSSQSYPEFGKKTYNLDLYKKPAPPLSSSLDLFRRDDSRQNSSSDKSRNVYEPFSYNHQNNGALPNYSLSNRSKIKQSEPFSYNHPEDTNVHQSEEATTVKRHKTKVFKPISEPFNYNRVQEMGAPANELNSRKMQKPIKTNLMNTPYATFESDAKPIVLTNGNYQLNDQQLIKPDPSAYLIQKPNNVLNSIDSNRLNISNEIYQSSFPKKEISDYCDRCHQFIDKDKYIFNFKSYHKKCYTCYRCNCELFRMKKVVNGLNEEGLYCEPCHTDMFGPKCPKCNETVTPYMLSTSYENKLYHKECFVCQRCRRSLANEKFVRSGNLIICKKCF